LSLICLKYNCLVRDIQDVSGGPAAGKILCPAAFGEIDLCEVAHGKRRNEMVSRS